MQLRRLELAGFKTFVDRTVLEFHPGITAIVGPNGSGKSNIFDGIRWALGETNARLLRGARMEDVIFSGSATRKPAGIASVALTLDNGAGLLPIEFSEVTVTRAVVRGGEGEYAINGVPCRLRDVQMLFLGTGLGGRSYALIGQGEVDAVLAASPVERRYWLEEAAGLARHKRQRTEAERRLDRAQAYLDRLTDVAEELERQQEALAAQAEAAARYQAYREETRELELALYADEARRLLGAVRRLTTQLAADRDALSAAETRVSETAAAAALVEARLAAVSTAWETGQQALLSGAEALSARASEVQACEAQAEGLRTRLDQLHADLAQFAAESAAVAADAALLGQEAAEASRRRADLLRDLEAAEAAMTAASAAAGDAHSRLTGSREDAVEVARTLAQARSDLAALAARVEMVGHTLEVATQKRGALGAVAAHLAQDYQRAQEACDDARRTLGAADEAVAAASQALDVLRQDVAASTEAMRAAELEEHRLAARLGALEEAAAQFLGFEESTRQVLLAAQAEPARFPGLRGALADLLSVPEDVRPAVAAALGERLHCLVVETPEQLAPILDSIRGRASGRTTALALQTLRAPRPGAGLDGRPDHGVRASEVVQADDGLIRAVQALLGETLIVENLAAAWRLFATGYPGQLVTRDGSVLSPEGVVTLGGSPAGETAPLGRQQIIAELRAAVAAAHARRGEATAQLDAAQGRLAAGEEAFRSLQGERGRIATLLAEQTQRLARLEEEIRRTADEEAAHSTEVRTASEILDRLRAEMARREADLRSLEDESRRLEAETLAMADEVRRLEAARERASAEVTARRLALVQLDGTVEAIRARLADRTTALADLDARRAAVAEAAERTSAALAEALRRHDEAQAAYDHLLQRQTEAKAEVERLAAERGRLRDELSQRQAEHAEALEALRAAEAAVHRTELRTTQAQAELATAAARLQEQYGVTLDEAASRRLEGSRDDARQRLEELHTALRALGPVNLRAIEEHAAISERLDAMRAHTDDLRRAGEALRGAIAHINAALRTRFRETFDEVNREFSRLFERLFEGGSGTLELVQDDPDAEPGLEVIAQLPGKRRRPLVALSGGERALVAITLIFAMLQVHPSPFCIFDEVEAALDDANTKRFTELLRDLAQKTQVLIITHNKGTMAAADILYGVTMQEPGLSSIVSVRLVPPSQNGERPPQEAEARVGGPNGEGPASRRTSARREPVALPAE